MILSLDVEICIIDLQLDGVSPSKLDNWSSNKPLTLSNSLSLSVDVWVILTVILEVKAAEIVAS